MRPLISDEHQQKALILKAIAHPTRLFILEQIAERKICVCDLTEMIGSDISTVSKHLAVLKHAGLISVERQGNQLFYHLKCPCILEFMSCIEQAAKQAAGDDEETQ